MQRTPSVALLLLGLVAGGQALDNGLALTPPMGWRSWNCFGRSVDQDKMEAIMEKMAQKNRTVDGNPTSLRDLGYDNCGLDDNWQKCGGGAFGSFHDANGNPIINADRFPDMKAMTDFAHSRGLRAGWYMNNCICAEHSWKGEENHRKHMVGSANAVAKYGFDGVKLDGCGQFLNLTWWSELLNATGRHVLIENCHWGRTTPGSHSSSLQGSVGSPSQNNGPCSGTTMPSNCPYNFFRTSGDIRANWGSMHRNLQSTRKFQGEPPLARPGTWAYPDMMEVGRMANFYEDRSHFGAWCITSSPLILGYDLRDESITDKVWEIIGNKEAIAVNQAWAGHPGRQVKVLTPSPSVVAPGDEVYAVPCNDSDTTQGTWTYDDAKKVVKGPHGNCLDGSSANKLELKACDGSALQQWSLGSDGTINSLGKVGYCVDIWAGHGLPGGPAVQLYKCHGVANEKFSFEGSGHLASQGKLCLAGRAGVEVWSKPLGGGKVAVLLLNNCDATSATLALSDVGITGSAIARDIWARKDLGKVQGGKFTAKLEKHDSAFVTFAPEELIV